MKPKSQCALELERVRAKLSLLETAISVREQGPADAFLTVQEHNGPARYRCKAYGLRRVDQGFVFVTFMVPGQKDSTDVWRFEDFCRLHVTAPWFAPVVEKFRIKAYELNRDRPAAI